MNDVLGQAIYDYHYRQSPGKLWINNRYGPKEQMPVGTYFRTEAQMPEMEHFALEQCRGRILDAGAGAGSHALLLQQKGFDVTALDISPLAVQVIQNRGVQQVIQSDIFHLANRQFDTILLLMNGIGLAGTLSRLPLLLNHLKTLLHPDGQILFDSSDVAYLYEGDMPDDIDYYGEIWYQYAYKKLKTDWFSWLYAHKKALSNAAASVNMKADVLFEDDYDQYLARITVK